MKRSLLLIMVILSATFSSITYSQVLSAGFHNGLNLSDIHGYTSKGRWKFKPGPLNGLSIDFMFNQSIGIKTGMDYMTVYYENVYYHEGYYYPHPHYPLPFSDLLVVSESSNYTSLTIPLQLKISIPAKPELNLMAGAYYSFMLNNALGDGQAYLSNANNDLGVIYSAGISHPLSDRITGSFDLRYRRGLVKLYDHSDYMHGTIDLVAGLSYRLLENSRAKEGATADTINGKIYLKYKGGFNISWNSGNVNRGRYSYYTGYSFGFDLGFEMSEGSYFRTGLLFERQGYSMKDSSDVFYLYHIEEDPDYDVESRISSDYIVLPAMLEFMFSDRPGVYFGLGPYIAFRLNSRCTGTAITDYLNNGIYRRDKITIYNDLEGITLDTDIGLIAAAGLSFDLPRHHKLDMGFQFRQGFSDIINTPNIDEDMQPQSRELLVRNSVMSFYVGLRVPVYKQK